MLLRIGVEDGNELTARTAIAMAARGCKAMFQRWLQVWTGGSSGPLSAAAAATAAAGKKAIKLKRTVATPAAPGGGGATASA
jgi:hypothetical protein